MSEPTLRIIETSITDKDSVRYWRIQWDDGLEGIESLYLDDTYLERIAPLLPDMWTLGEIYALG